VENRVLEVVVQPRILTSSSRHPVDRE
jgi:hypothetical protein